MNDHAVRALKSYRVDLIKGIHPNAEWWGALLQEGVFTEGMIEEIQHEKTRSEKISKMLDILPTRGPMAFDKFCQVLDHVASWHSERLRQQYSEEKQRAKRRHGDRKVNSSSQQGLVLPNMDHSRCLINQQHGASHSRSQTPIDMATDTNLQEELNMLYARLQKKAPDDDRLTPFLPEQATFEMIHTLLDSIFRDFRAVRMENNDLRERLTKLMIEKRRLKYKRDTAVSENQNLCSLLRWRDEDIKKKAIELEKLSQQLKAVDSLQDSKHSNGNPHHIKKSRLTADAEAEARVDSDSRKPSETDREKQTDQHPAAGQQTSTKSSSPTQHSEAIFLTQPNINPLLPPNSSHYSPPTTANKLPPSLGLVIPCKESQDQATVSLNTVSKQTSSTNFHVRPSIALNARTNRNSIAHVIDMKQTGETQKKYDKVPKEDHKDKASKLTGKSPVKEDSNPVQACDNGKDTATAEPFSRGQGQGHGQGQLPSELKVSSETSMLSNVTNTQQLVCERFPTHRGAPYKLARSWSNYDSVHSGNYSKVKTEGRIIDQVREEDLPHATKDSTDSSAKTSRTTVTRSSVAMAKPANTAATVTKATVPMATSKISGKVNKSSKSPYLDSDEPRPKSGKARVFQRLQKKANLNKF